MTATLYTRNGPVPRDENIIRSTTNVVDISSPAAEQAHTPDVNEIAVDTREDGGLSANTLASHVVPTEQYSPVVTNANTDMVASVNAQISTSGTAAQREMAGEWGHGTLKIVEGIEPTIVDGTAFDNLYFKAHVGVVQGPAGEYMSAGISDPTVTGLVEQRRRALADKAAQGPIYQQWLDGQGQ